MANGSYLPASHRSRYGRFARKIRRHDGDVALGGLGLLSIFSISVAWEFWLVQLIGPLLGIEGEQDSLRDHWEYIVTSTVLAGMALILPTMALLRGAREQRLRGIVENSPASISLKAADGRYLMVNDQFEKLTGLSRDDIKGKKSDEIFPEDFARSGMDHDRDVLRSGQASTREASLDVAGRDHSFLPFKFPISGIGGNVVAIGAIHTDNTERKRAEERTLRSNARPEPGEGLIMDSEQPLESLDAKYPESGVSVTGPYCGSADAPAERTE